MPRIVLKTPDNKKLVVDPTQDPKLYDSPHNPPNTGTKYTRGTDYYAHKSRSGKWYFYAYSWSMWQGDEGGYTLVSKEDVEDFLIDRLAEDGWGGLSEDDVEGYEEYGFNLFEETA